MRNLIRKILLEEFDNEEVMSQEHNICDIMSANTWKEIDELLDKMEYDNQHQDQIDQLRDSMKNEMDTLSNDKDIVNTYLRKIQNIVCR
jgi:hypothetical protein